MILITVLLVYSSTIVVGFILLFFGLGVLTLVEEKDISNGSAAAVRAFIIYSCTIVGTLIVCGAVAAFINLIDIGVI